VRGVVGGGVVEGTVEDGYFFPNGEIRAFPGERRRRRWMVGFSGGQVVRVVIDVWKSSFQKSSYKGTKLLPQRYFQPPYK